MDLACLEHLSVKVTTQFATNEQLKDLTHMLCFRIPCCKLYREVFFSYFLTLKYMCHFGMNFTKFKLKEKHKVFLKIIHGYSLVCLILSFPTYLPT